MKKFAKDLIFISRIKRDGSGTTPVSKDYLQLLCGNSFPEEFDVHRLSISNDTYIAIGFNSFGVKLKNK